MSRTDAIEQLIAVARQNKHRQLIVLAGDETWALEEAACIQDVACEASALALSQIVWVSHWAPEDTAKASVRDLHGYLGTETGLVIYNAYDGFNPNAFGQISGTLRGGGLFVLICPEIPSWPAYGDPEHKALMVEPYQVEQVGRRFVTRLSGLLSQQDNVCLVTEDQPLNTAGFAVIPDVTQKIAAPYASECQQQAVELILKTLSRGRRPVVVTADRGRGKSAALGISAAHLVQSGTQQVWVTAPALDSAHEVFAHAKASLPDAVAEKGCVRTADAEIRFVAPDDACRLDGTGAVLLVDEAAAIPAPVLARLLDRFPRVVFSSTIHGYEGTGQGFAVRFRRELDRRTPNWRQAHLTQPIRWSANDPLEAFVFKSLLLDAAAVPDDVAEQLEEQTVSVQLLDRDSLVADEALLAQLFGLLVLAHYRTTPGDLRILLDSPNVKVWVAQIGDHVVGATLIAEEGPIPMPLAQVIWEGKRRPKGHLLPQTLVGQEGYLEAAPLRCGRIMRTAVHPMLQRRGIARQMLREVSEYGQAHQWDYLGSSFGATEDLLLFWQNNGFGAIRLGENRDPVSGTHAALVCRPLSDPGRLMYNHLRDRFTQQLPLLLGYNLRDLEVEVLPMLLQGMRFDTELSSHDSRDLEAFVLHNRSYESCIVPIRKLVIRSLKNTSVWHALTPDELSLLVSKALQQRSWEEIDAEAGRRVLLRRMRALIGECLRLS